MEDLPTQRKNRLLEARLFLILLKQIIKARKLANIYFEFLSPRKILGLFSPIQNFCF